MTGLYICPKDVKEDHIMISWIWVTGVGLVRQVEKHTVYWPLWLSSQTKTKGKLKAKGRLTPSIWQYAITAFIIIFLRTSSYTAYCHNSQHLEQRSQMGAKARCSKLSHRLHELAVTQSARDWALQHFIFNKESPWNSTLSCGSVGC